jgi:hypothetical protein
VRPTLQGLLFRTFRLLFLLTMIAGFFSACLSGLEGLQAPVPSKPPTPAPAQR